HSNRSEQNGRLWNSCSRSRSARASYCGSDRSTIPRSFISFLDRRVRASFVRRCCGGDESTIGRSPRSRIEGVMRTEDINDDHGHHQQGHDHHDHDHHDHSHAVSADADRRYLTVALVLIVGFMVFEVVVGILAHSLALLSDAGHMLTDAGALVLSLIVIRLVQRPTGGRLTYGMRRAEVLSGQANGAVLLVLGALVTYEAIVRLIQPPEVQGVLVTVVAALGVAVNLAAAWVLAKANRQSLNIEGSFQHIVTDLYAF